jgi:hypothetical protein
MDEQPDRPVPDFDEYCKVHEIPADTPPDELAEVFVDYLHEITDGGWDGQMREVTDEDGGATDESESPRADTDCICKAGGSEDCPCEADGPDGLCACCRTGDHRGSCVDWRTYLGLSEATDG